MEPYARTSLPNSIIRTAVPLHVPDYERRNHKLEHHCQTAALVFIGASRNGCRLETAEIRPAERVARLYSNGLNQLAHFAGGLPAATRIARSVPLVRVTEGTVEARIREERKLL